MNRLLKINKAFSLLEIIIAVFLLSVLVVGVVVLINPPRQFAKSRNFVRLSDITAINKALSQYAVEHNGQYPSGISYQLKEICKEGVSVAQCTANNLVDLSVLSVDQKYLAEIPADPLVTNLYGSGYWITKLSGRQIVLEAPLSELGEFISTQDTGSCQAECNNKECGSSDGCGGICSDSACVTDLDNIVISDYPSNYVFAGSVYDYSGLLVSSSVSSVTITPTGAGVITVDGQSVISGTASAPIFLEAGLEQIITVKVSITDKASKTYTIKIKRKNDGFYGTGGVVSYDGNYTIHTFTSSGVFSANGNGNIDFLIIAGGGAGGFDNGGGGGAGGVIYKTSTAITAGDKTVIVGSGGTSTGRLNRTGSDGQNSSFNGYTATGGGAGGENDKAGWPGGSGGGAGYFNKPGGVGVVGQGYNGGQGGLYYRGGGGGGATSQGDSSNFSGNGGAGIFNSITGSSVAYAGGGGGGTLNRSTTLGGIGGGGNGGNNKDGSSALPNTGSGGGGGGGSYFHGGNGGSGIVIIRYLTPIF